MKVDTIFNRVLDVFALLAAALLIFILFSVSAGVVTRYFMGRPLQWVIELSEYSLLYITFLAATWLLRKEGHVKIDIILNRLKPRAEGLLNSITSIFAAVICLPLVWYGARLTWEYFQMGRFHDTPLQFPQAFVLGIIPLGSFLLFIQFLKRTYGYLKSRRVPTDKQ